ncbi:MAG: cold shock domain-containing protein [Ottowia sp.]|nr:cold shock domain-containing protein [Ottowia sp.]
MPSGRVKWFSNQRGFGFIEPEGGGPDVFAHFSAIEMDGFKTLKEGAQVDYDVSEGPKGLMATRIRNAAPIAAPPEVLDTDDA